MPAHIHLLCSRQEIVDHYRDAGYPDKAWQAALHWFFEAPIINRVFYDDYMAIFEEETGSRLSARRSSRSPIGMGRPWGSEAVIVSRRGGERWSHHQDDLRRERSL